ncbi:excalibur calcium-binding domain-containing protein [Flavobacterium pectinovorum]|uniref:excalibur calcium-binding domain-containing protein n=1 Tax=Flavobacterium pectinovorum TaxID=29533 RepID=UPI001FAC6BD3|nr:excalibur calcium-binding domain-containing protein [Flavobacterium pectinovorum]MCI9847002.1 excalibur calcium-binding domain-containing protein [Flavobacterium pectinovorum]
MKHNKLIIILLAVFTVIAFSISCSSDSNSDCPTKTCGDFANQQEAQSAYDNNKSCYKNLDSDGDGIACENLKK